MLEHIVKNGETLQDILNMYHIELEEVKEYNLHITDFHNLVSGMKIRIPLLHNEIEQILENTESFVQKYYPKINEIYGQNPMTEERIIENMEQKEEKPKIQEGAPSKPISSPKPKGKPYPGILPPKSPYSRT